MSLANDPKQLQHSTKNKISKPTYVSIHLHARAHTCALAHYIRKSHDMRNPVHTPYKPQFILYIIISEHKQINLPMWGFADSWMTKARDAPTYNFKTHNKVTCLLIFNITKFTLYSPQPLRQSQYQETML